MDLLNEDKNTHLEHLEDDIINNGYEGGQNAINFLISLNENPFWVKILKYI